MTEAPQRLPAHGAEVERARDGYPLVRPQLIATDVDGTILSYQNTGTCEISQRTIDALAAAHNAGIHVVCVTGRPMRWMHELAARLSYMDAAICSNGAVIYDMAHDAVIESHALSYAETNRVRDALLGHWPAAKFAVETTVGFGQESRFSEATGRPADIQRPASAGHASALITGETLPTMLAADDEVLKLLLAVGGADPDELLNDARELLGSAVSITRSAPNMPLLEMSRGDVNKAVTLADYAASLGIHANDVVALGDMPNDIEMIRWAGTGFAVASGHPTLRSVADAIAPGCDEDGVATVIEYLLNLEH